MTNSLFPFPLRQKSDKRLTARKEKTRAAASLKAQLVFSYFQGSQIERRPGKSYTRNYDGAGPNERRLIC